MPFNLNPQNLERIGYGFWIFFSVFFIYFSYRLGLGTLSAPEPGLIPFLASALLLLIAIVKLFQKRIKEADLPDARLPKEWAKMVSLTISLFLYSFLLEWAGFNLLTFIWLLFLFGLSESRRSISSILLALATVIVSYIVFGILFQLQLPKGFLGI